MTNETCAQRITKQMTSREQSLAEMFNNLTNAEDDQRIEDAQESLDVFALGITRRILLRVEISTGGPADYLTIECVRDGYALDVQRVTYHFADWFDHAEQDIDKDSALWRYAEMVAEYESGREQ